MFVSASRGFVIQAIWLSFFCATLFGQAQHSTEVVSNPEIQSHVCYSVFSAARELLIQGAPSSSPNSPDQAPDGEMILLIDGRPFDDESPFHLFFGGKAPFSHDVDLFVSGTENLTQVIKNADLLALNSMRTEFLTKALPKTKRREKIFLRTSEVLNACRDLCFSFSLGVGYLALVTQNQVVMAELMQYFEGSIGMTYLFWTLSIRARNHSETVINELVYKCEDPDFLTELLKNVESPSHGDIFAYIIRTLGDRPTEFTSSFVVQPTFQSPTINPSISFIFGRMRSKSGKEPIPFLKLKFSKQGDRYHHVELPPDGDF